MKSIRILFSPIVMNSDFYNNGCEAKSYHYEVGVSRQKPINFSAITKNQVDENTCILEEKLNNPPYIPPTPNHPIFTPGVKKNQLEDEYHINGNTDSTIIDQLISTQNEWNTILPFLLNEVLTNTQAVVNPISDYVVPSGISLPGSDAIAVSWLAGQSVEADLQVSQIYVMNGYNGAAYDYINTIASNWTLSVYQTETITDYIKILQVIGNDKITDLSTLQLSQIQSLYDLNQINPATKSWVKSIVYYYGIEYPFEYTTPSGTRTRNSINEDTQLVVYPNPGKDVLTVNTVTQGIITVYDLNGQIIYTGNKIEEVINIDTRFWQSGIYIINVKSESKSESIKCLKL